MSFFSSRPKKIKRKGTVRELKIVETVSRSGRDTLKAEELKTPRPNIDHSQTANHRNTSSSPSKRRKTEFFDQGQDGCDFEDVDLSNGRQTLVFFSALC